MKSYPTTERLEEAVLFIAKRVNDYPNLKWDQIQEQTLWYELVACILGSNVKFELAQCFAEYLNTQGLLKLKENQDYNLFEKKICDTLSNPFYCSLDNKGKKQKYRYPKLKANHIRKSAETIYQQGSSLKKILYDCKNSYEARIHVTQKAIGIGPKQASLFLRNIGYADNLAILDVHVVRYMSLLGSFPQRLKGIKNLFDYEKLEKILQNYAEKFCLSISNLDTAIWIVMRVYQKEFVH